MMKLVEEFVDIFMSEDRKVGNAPEQFVFWIDLKPGAQPVE